MTNHWLLNHKNHVSTVSLDKSSSSKSLTFDWLGHLPSLLALLPSLTLKIILNTTHIHQRLSVIRGQSSSKCQLVILKVPGWSSYFSHVKNPQSQVYMFLWKTNILKTVREESGASEPSRL